MAKFTNIHNGFARQVSAGKGFKQKWSTLSFPGTALTATLDTDFSVIEMVIPVVIGAPAADSYDLTVVQVSALAATSNGYTVRVPRPGIISAVRLTVNGTTGAGGVFSTSDTNNWKFKLTNKGAAGSGSLAPVVDTDATNSTAATGGTAFTSLVERDLTLSATPSDLVVVTGDILQFAATKTSNPDSLTFLNAVISITGSTNGHEQLYWADSLATDGKLHSKTITIARTAIATPTNNLKIGAFILGY